jgi:connector GP10
MTAIPKKMKNSISSWESNQLNMDTYNMYFTQLKNMCISLFEWSGLPDTVNERFLEQTLFEFGHVAFVNDPVYGFLGLPSNLSGVVNMYGEPIKIMAQSFNYQREFDVGKDCVIIYHTNIKEGTESVARLYAQRLYEVERATDVNIKTQKFPIIVMCSEQQRMTLKNLMSQYDGNEHLVFSHKNLDLESVKVLNTEAPFVADKLINYKHNLWNECMMKLGISNFNQMKKERLVESETNANAEQVKAFRNGLLTMRLKACEQINKLFNLNVSVKFRVEDEEENSEDGKVYDDDQGDTRE